MKRRRDIEINEQLLDLLMTDKEKSGYNLLLEKGVICMNCGGICSEGVEVTEIHLNPLNDIFIRGICLACKNKVARTMEFGEHKDFSKKGGRIENITR